MSDDRQRQDEDLIEIQHELLGVGEDWENDEPVSARTMTPYNEFEEKNVVVFYPDGQVGLSIHAYNTLGKPKRVVSYMRQSAVAITGSNIKGSAAVTDGNVKTRVVRFSNTLLVKRLGYFNNGGPYFCHAMLKGKYLICLWDNPYYNGSDE